MHQTIGHLLVILFLFVVVIDAKQRIRKEIRQISSSQWLRIVDAIKIMKYTDEVEGQLRYGPLFRNYDSLVGQHLTAALDPNGDAG